MIELGVIYKGTRYRIAVRNNLPLPLTVLGTLDQVVDLNTGTYIKDKIRGNSGSLINGSERFLFQQSYLYSQEEFINKFGIKGVLNK